MFAGSMLVTPYYNKSCFCLIHFQEHKSNVQSAICLSGANSWWGSQVKCDVAVQKKKFAPTYSVDITNGTVRKVIVNDKVNSLEINSSTH